jgi:hypothetical protein
MGYIIIINVNKTRPSFGNHTMGTALLNAAKHCKG